MRIPTTEIQNAVLEHRSEKGIKSYEMLRKVYGVNVSRGTLSRIARGQAPVSLAAENDVRRAFGYDLLRPESIASPRAGHVYYVDSCYAVEDVTALAIPVIRRKIAATKSDSPSSRYRFRPDLPIDAKRIVEENRRDGESFGATVYRLLLKASED